MTDYFEIIAAGGSDSLVTLIIFIIIIAAKVIGGIVKSAKENQDAQRQDQKRKNSRDIAREQGQRRYKPVEQWKTDEKTHEPSRAYDRERNSDYDNEENALERALRAKKEMLEKQRLAQQKMHQPMAIRKESYEQKQRRHQAENQQKQQLKKQKLLEQQKQLLLEQKEKAEEMQRLKEQKAIMAESYVSEFESYGFAEMSIENIRNVVVATEILGKPIALRGLDEKVF